MEQHWGNKKVVLDDVAEKVEQFFLERNFMTKRQKSNNSISLVAFQKFAKMGAKHVEVTISQGPNGLTIKFESGRDSRVPSPISSIISLFGGGILLKKELESAEFYQKLEEDFWRKTEEIVSESTYK